MILYTTQPKTKSCLFCDLYVPFDVVCIYIPCFLYLMKWKKGKGCKFTNACICRFSVVRFVTSCVRSINAFKPQLAPCPIQYFNDTTKENVSFLAFAIFISE